MSILRPLAVPLVSAARALALPLASAAELGRNDRTDLADDERDRA